MSKFLTIETTPETYFINDITFTDSLIFRTTWSILEDFERTFDNQISEIPKLFIEDIKELVESVIERPGYGVYEFLEDFENQFRLHRTVHRTIHSFRIPNTIYDYGDKAIQATRKLNKKLEANFYKFKTFVIYPETALVKDFLKELGVYEKVYQDLVNMEVESTMSDDWDILRERTDAEISYHSYLNDHEKQIFAYGHAYTYVHDLMILTLHQFHQYGHFDFLDPDFNYTRMTDGHYEFDLSTFYVLKN